MPTRIAIVYYSATGNVHKLAEAMAEGAREAGAEVRLLRVPELAPEEAIQANPAWAAHRDAVAQTVPEATLDDLDWADGIALGTPTRYGTMAAQLKQFVDQTGGLWGQGKLANKAVTSFASAMNPNGGQESTILSFNNIFYHWGAIIVPPGYTDPSVFAAGGNPYGVSFASGGTEAVGDPALAVARYQGARLTEYAGKILTREDEENVPAEAAEAYRNA